MPTNRALTPELLDVRDSVWTVFFKRLTQIQPQYSQVAKMETSNKAFEDTFKVAGLGTFQIKPEGHPISYDDPVQGPRKRVTHTTFALGFRVTEEARDDDQHGIIRRMPEDLADSSLDHDEQIFWNVFNTAFVNTNFTTLDGQPLCDTAHVNLKTGTTQTNELNPGVALSHAGLEDAMTILRTTLNDQDRPIQLNPQKLLVHPEDEWEAQRILETEFQPGGDMNDINTMMSSRTGLMPMAVRYFTDTDNWFITCSEHTITWYTRKELANDTNMDTQTKDMLFDARKRISVVPWDWFGVLGSQV